MDSIHFGNHVTVIASNEEPVFIDCADMRGVDVEIAKRLHADLGEAIQFVETLQARRILRKAERENRHAAQANLRSGKERRGEWIQIHDERRAGVDRRQLVSSLERAALLENV